MLNSRCKEGARYDIIILFWNDTSSYILFEGFINNKKQTRSRIQTSQSVLQRILVSEDTSLFYTRHWLVYP